jgi:hypothetical protein
MVLFEQLLDALGKEAKEAPGWLALIIACNLLPVSLLLPRLDWILASVAIDVHREHGAIATLVAITLFFIGDSVDTILFPRARGGDRMRKLLHSTLLVLAAWATFMTAQRNWLAAVLWVILVVPYPIYSRLHNQGNGSNQKPTGFAWLVPGSLSRRLDKAQSSAKSALGLSSGIYSVSKALAQAGGIYTGWIMMQNESAKFVRSAVFPLAVWTIWLLWNKQWHLALGLGLGAATALWLYSLLKALHMCRLYEGASNLQGFQAEELPEGIRVFLWKSSAQGEEKYSVVGSGAVDRRR